MNIVNKIKIDLSYIEPDLNIDIFSKTQNTIFFDANAIEYCESTYQIVEGFFYDYKINKDTYSIEQSTIVENSLVSRNTGIIKPNTYVGTLILNLLKENEYVGFFEIEVRSIKSGYREDYKKMLTDISDISIELLYAIGSVSTFSIKTNFDRITPSEYQKFEYIKSFIIDTHFDHCINQIQSSPATRWRNVEELCDMRKIGKVNSQTINQIAKATNRIPNPLVNLPKLKSLPRNIHIFRKQDTVDTIENRLIKHILEEVIEYMYKINNLVSGKTPIKRDSLYIAEKLTSICSNDFFKQISRLTAGVINSPILQRKDGYREVYQFWLKIDLAGQISIFTSNDSYKVGVKNLAKIYEYWCYLKLYSLLSHFISFDKSSLAEMISSSENGLRFNFAEGASTKITGEFCYNNYIVNIDFYYNKLFNTTSWTIPLKPDYTIVVKSIFTKDTGKSVSNNIYNMHFDAKYKIHNIKDLLTLEEDISKETKQNDLIKMHAYSLGITNSISSYILFPGNMEKNFTHPKNKLQTIGAIPFSPHSMTQHQVVKLLINSIETIVKNH